MKRYAVYWLGPEEISAQDLVSSPLAILPKSFREPKIKTLVRSLPMLARDRHQLIRATVENTDEELWELADIMVDLYQKGSRGRVTTYILDLVCQELKRRNLVENPNNLLDGLPAV
jgi:hypothetical protein